MKRVSLLFFASAFVSFLISSCNKQVVPDNKPDDPNNKPNETEEYVELALRPRGIDVSISPMSTKSNSSDIYIVTAFKGDPDWEWDDMDAFAQNQRTPDVYATWVTDDLASEKFKLIKNAYYTFAVAYFPNGQNIVKGKGYAPFHSIGETCPYLGDGICYGAKFFPNGALEGSVMKKDDQPVQLLNGYYFNDVDRYHGGAAVVATASATLDVDLYRQMFGLDIIATNFTEGTLHVVPFDSDVNNAFWLTPSNPSVSKVLELPQMPFGISLRHFKDWVSEVRFHIDYINPEGKTITIYTSNLYYKRMTKITITIDINSVLEDIEAGLNPNVISNEEWSDLSYTFG